MLPLNYVGYFLERCTCKKNLRCLLWYSMGNTRGTIAPGVKYLECPGSVSFPKAPLSPEPIQPNCNILCIAPASCSPLSSCALKDGQQAKAGTMHKIAIMGWAVKKVDVFAPSLPPSLLLRENASTLLHGPSWKTLGHTGRWWQHLYKPAYMT